MAWGVETWAISTTAPGLPGKAQHPLHTLDLGEGGTAVGVVPAGDPALLLEFLGVITGQIVVFRVEGADQTGFGQLLHTDHQLGVIRHGQALKLLLPALGRGVEEGLVGHNPAVLRQLGDVLGVLALAAP